MDATREYLNAEATRLVAAAKALARKGCLPEAERKIAAARRLVPATFEARLAIGDVSGAAEIGDKQLGIAPDAKGYGLPASGTRVVRLPKRPDQLKVRR